MRKLKAITIKGLFGRHDYTLNFDEKGGFTMLAAPNGYGKSTILKIIRAIASGNMFYFWNLDFKRVIVDFEEADYPTEKHEESFWIVKTLADADILNKTDMAFSYYFDQYVESLQPHHKQEPYSDFNNETEIPDPLQDEFNKFYGKFSNYTKNRLVVKFAGTSIPQTKLIDQDVWNFQKYLAKITGTKASQVSISDLFYKNSPECLSAFQMHFSWIQDSTYWTGIDHIYIGANREISGTNIFETGTFTAKQISKLIAYNGRIHKESNTAYSQNLDEKLVSYILDSINKTKRTPSELKASIDRRIQEINKFKASNGSFGIFNDLERKTTDVDSKRISETKDRTALTIIDAVLESNWSKLNFFKFFTDQLTLFRDSLNRMLSYTKVVPTINGFTIHSEDPNSGETRELPLDALSSGEQQLIVLLGIMLFVTRSEDLDEKTLILLDEPEISMHPAWQEELAEFIWNVKEKFNKEFIIATHSPTFIGRRWNNVFELAELADSNKSEE